MIFIILLITKTHALRYGSSIFNLCLSVFKETEDSKLLVYFYKKIQVNSKNINFIIDVESLYFAYKYTEARDTPRCWAMVSIDFLTSSRPLSFSS